MPVDTDKEFRSLLAFGLLPIGFCSPLGVPEGDEASPIAPSATGVWREYLGSNSTEDDTQFAMDGTLISSDVDTGGAAARCKWDDDIADETTWKDYTVECDVETNDASQTLGIAPFTDPADPVARKGYRIESANLGPFYVWAVGWTPSWGSTPHILPVTPSLGSIYRIKCWIREVTETVDDVNNVFNVLSVKVWDTVLAEPAEWQAVLEDGHPSRTTGGTVALIGISL